MIYLPLILFTVLSNAAAQLMLKQGMLTLGPMATEGPLTLMSVITIVFKVAFHPWVFFGLCTFVVSMMTHLYVLSKVELSFVYPFLSLAFVAVAVGSWVFFAEDINAWRVLGIGFICVGTMLIAHSGSNATDYENQSENVTAPATTAMYEGSKS
jgi:drug/metabolite transporter (DMT)-like permease